MSIWQTKNWQELLIKSGQAEKIFEISGILFEKRSIGLGLFGLFALGVEKEFVSIEKEIIELCKKEKCLFVQIEDINTSPLAPLLQERGISKLKSGYYKKFITPYTALIDLEKSEEQILSEMKQKGRYNIKLAQKKGIIVKEVDKNDENIKIFYDLMVDTTSRDKFSGNSLNYYKNFLNIISKSSLLFAYFEDKVISAGIFVFDKEVSIYYYGASTSDVEYRNLMAPYLLQWSAIQKAKSIESKYYDFLGVATPGDKKSHLLGVTDFKMKFTSDIREVSKSYIWVNNKFLYFVIGLLRKVRK